MSTRAEIQQYTNEKIITNNLRKIKASELNTLLSMILESYLHSQDSINHNSLSNLNDGDYKHITASQLSELATLLANTSGVNTGDQDLSSYATTTFVSNIEASLIDLIAEKQDELGFIPEQLSNKVQNFTDPSNINKYPSVPAVVTYVAQQIANLVASAPGTLDTLNELAAALGNDPNFATTITTALSNKQTTLVSGTNIKTINGQSILGGGNFDIQVGGKIGVLSSTTGIPTYYSAPEDAVTAASSGDTIFVYPGTYTITTTASNGLSKDGVNWYLYPNVIFNKATVGDLFNDTGFTNTCNVFGYGTFNKTTAAGYICYNTKANAIFEARTVTSNIDHIFGTTRALMEFNVAYATCTGTSKLVLNMLQSNNYGDCKVKINMLHWKATSSSCIGGSSWWYYTNLIITGNTLESTSHYAIVQYNSGCTLHLNIGRILGVTYALVSADGYGDSPNIVNCNFCTGIYDIGKNYILNGDFTSLNYTGSNQFNYIRGGHFLYITLSGNGHVKTDIMPPTSAGITPTITQSAGVLDITIVGGHYGLNFNITGGVCNMYGQRSQHQLSNSGDRIINGGILNLYTSFTHGGGADNGLWYIMKLQSGTLRLFSNIYNTFNQVGAVQSSIEGSHGIIWVGGKLIIESSTITVAGTTSYPIKANSAGLQLRVNGRLSHNKPADGGVLAGKKHKYKYVVAAVATTSLYCNDTTGGDEYFQETDTTTYNTKPLLAQRMAALINASGTLDITASQDTPGTDDYFYLEHDIEGINFKWAGNTNTANNLANSTIRIGSYAMTEICGGVINENTNIE